MTEERRYDEEEVARILEAATETQSSVSARTGPSGGLTLSELQEIAGEVGISRDLVARAAAQVDSSGPAERGGPLGIPTRVSRVVDLPRALTDHEWDRLVAELRRTFGARGKVDRSGSLREWRNGNLHVLVEPTAAGYQLDMQTRKGDVAPFLFAGSAVLIIAAVVFMVGLITGDVDVRPILILGFLGIAGLTANIARLPIWSRTRARQMEELAATVSEWTALPPPQGDENR